MGTKLTAPPINKSRYARSLEQAPALLESLQDASSNEITLRDEVGLARTLLDTVLQQLGEFHARTGKINPLAIDGVKSMLQQVQSIVVSAAAIEAKRTDQKISATHMLTLLVHLRDDLKRRLQMAFGEQAATVVEETFANARWTGSLRDEDVHDALLEPAAFDLRLRPVDREGDVIKEGAKALNLNSAEVAAIASSADAAKAKDPLTKLLLEAPRDAEPLDSAVPDVSPVEPEDQDA